MDINQIKLDNNFKLVEASAGTGKSFTLAHLVLRNVLENKVKPASNLPNGKRSNFRKCCQKAYRLLPPAGHLSVLVALLSEEP